MTGIDSFTLIAFGIVLYLLIVLVPSGLVFLILNKFLNKKAKFLTIYIGSTLFPILPQAIFSMKQIKLFFNNEITGFHYTIWIVSTLLGGYLGYVIFKSIKNNNEIYER